MTARSRRVRGVAGKDAGGRRTPCGAVTTRTQPAAFLAGEAARSIRRRTTRSLDLGVVLGQLDPDEGGDEADHAVPAARGEGGERLRVGREPELARARRGPLVHE